MISKHETGLQRTSKIKFNDFNHEEKWYLNNDEQWISTIKSSKHEKGIQWT